ncbi:hypothetical protein Pcinc_020709 [Petrolisthes cinctipes]|uniref:Protein kinase domain-containing protein n=1 Tax=Petrolisthes cinctipes TaxID=88211 RepID=A0AAE1FHG4_PETCI|nr:hypothetical protein Pcinc_020709 [Petrolisthes cinctipes]
MREGTRKGKEGLRTEGRRREGKFGAVRRARHRSTGLVYAAKYVRRRRRNESVENETRHEVAVLLLGLRDPHIVTLHQVYETRIEYIILLEFAGGGDLQRVLDEEVSIPEEAVRVLLRQVLRGLAFLHAHSIAHLDIKPQNLVMMGDTPDAGVKLVDFGLSRVISQGNELTQIMGTPDYVAPEVINFEPISLATDMWSIGVLTYVFLTGCTPFGGETDNETFVNITRAEVDFPEELFATVSDQAKDFICGLLVKKPSDRLTVDECLSHVWMTAPASPILQPLITDSLDDVQEEEEEEEEETSGYHSVYSSSSSYSPPDDPYSDQVDSTYSNPDDPYSSSTYASPAPTEPYSTTSSSTYSPPTADHLYPLPETDQGDSAYSSDSSSSPTFTEGYSTGLVVPPLCHCTIPEEQHQQQQQQKQQVRPQTLIAGALTLSRRQRNRGMTADMEESLRLHQNRRQPRATRRASLVLDDPRYLQDHHLHDILRPNLADVQHEVALTRDSDVDSGVSCHDCDDSRLESQRLCHLDSYDGVDAASVVSWDDYADLGRQTLNQYDQATLCSIAKPWEKLCNGSVSRAMTQLTVKKVPKNPELRGSKSDLMGSNCDLRGSRNDLHVSKSELRASKAELRMSKSDLRASKSDLRASKSDLRASKSDLRASKSDLRASKADLRASKPDLRASRSDLRASKSDLRASKSDLRGSKSDLRASRTDLRGSRTNLTLSRLDLPHETLNNSCVTENERDELLRCDLTLPRRTSIDRNALASFMRGNSLHMSFRVPKRRDMQI